MESYWAERLFARHLRATNQWVDKDHARKLFEAVRAILVSDTEFRHYLVASYQLNIPISEGSARNYFDAVENNLNKYFLLSKSVIY